MRKNIFTKIRRRVSNILHQVVYYNYAYKPTGIYNSSKEYFTKHNNTKANYIEVYSNLISNLTISEDLFKACSDYIKPLLIVETTYKVVVIPNGRIHTDNAASVAVIAEDNKLIGDVSFNYKNSRVVSPDKNNIFKQRYFTKPQEIQGTVFTLLTGGSGINNYFHWLIDTLPRIHLLKKSGLFDKIDWFLVPSFHYTYQKDTLRLLGIDKNKIIEGDKHPHIKASTLIASTAPRGDFAIIPIWVCDFLRKSFVKRKTQSVDRHIYISRKDSAIRHVLNEEAVTALLDTYGFKTFVLNELTFEEQVNLFASAEIIIAPHGAGLINLAFCKENTKVLEIFASGYVKATYHDLSKKIGLNYYHLICESKIVESARKGMKLDIFVDLSHITNILNKDLLPKKQDLQLSNSLES